MSIAIAADKCVGCGLCTEVCPGNLLQITAGKAAIRDVRDCWGCTACVKECPQQAIYYYLAADLGGSGGRLYAENTKNEIKWQMYWPDGSFDEIVTAKGEANKY